MVENKEFAVIALNLENIIFVVYIVCLDISNVYSFYRAKIASLKANKAFIIEYSNFTDIFFSELVA